VVTKFCFFPSLIQHGRCHSGSVSDCFHWTIQAVRQKDGGQLVFKAGRGTVWLNPYTLVTSWRCSSLALIGRAQGPSRLSNESRLTPRSNDPLDAALGGQELSNFVLALGLTGVMLTGSIAARVAVHSDCGSDESTCPFAARTPSYRNFAKEFDREGRKTPLPTG
jgi:hypothetical protein